MSNRRQIISESELRSLISAIITQQSSNSREKLDEIGFLAPAALALLGIGAGVGAGIENLSAPKDTWIKGTEVCKKKAEFDTTLGANPSKLIPIKLSKYVMPDYRFAKQVNFEEERERAEAPLKVEINSAYSIQTDEGEAVLLYTSSGSIARTIKEFRTRSCRPEELQAGGVVYEKLKLAYGNDQRNFKRHLSIAAIDSDDKLSKSSSFNGSLHYYVISQCNNDYLRSELQKEDAQIQKSDSVINRDMITDWLKKVVTADRSLWSVTGIGDAIEKMSLEDQQWMVDTYNKLSSALGLAGFIHPAFASATIGMNLVLGIYYERMQPDSKLFGVKLSTINYVCAALCAFTGATQSLVFAKQTSDISIMVSQFANIRNINGLAELNVVARGTQSSRFTLQHVRNFCQLFPEISNPIGWTKAGSGWNYILSNGKAITDASGKLVLFSDDVKSFTAFYQSNPTIISQYIEWYQGMPGLFGKLMITGGAALDAITLAGLFDTPAGENAKNEAVSVSIDVAALDTKSITSTVLLQGVSSDNLKKYVEQTPEGLVTIINQETKQTKTLPIDFYQNDLVYVIQHMLGKSGGDNFDATQAKVLITDDQLYNNFDLFLEFPELFDKTYINPGERVAQKEKEAILDKRSTIAYKISNTVYVLLTTTTAREIAATKKIIPYNEKVSFFETFKEKLNTLQKLNQEIIIKNYLIQSQPNNFSDIKNLPNNYREDPSRREIDEVSKMYPLYTYESTIEQYSDAILKSDEYNSILDKKIADASKKLQEIRTTLEKISSDYKKAVKIKYDNEMKIKKSNIERGNRGPKY